MAPVLFAGAMRPFYKAFIFNTSRPSQNYLYFADDILKCIIKERAWIPIGISYNL